MYLGFHHVESVKLSSTYFENGNSLTLTISTDGAYEKSECEITMYFKTRKEAERIAQALADEDTSVRTRDD